MSTPDEGGPTNLNTSEIKGFAYIYKSDGNIEYRTYEAAPSLEGLQEAVGGYLETVPYWTKHDGRECVAFCNEEGKIHKLPLNIRATNLWYKDSEQRSHLDDVLVGDIILLMGNQAFMESI